MIKCFIYSVVPPYRMKCEPCLAAGYCLHKHPASTQTYWLGKSPSGHRTAIIGEDEDGDPVVSREPIY